MSTAAAVFGIALSTFVLCGALMLRSGVERTVIGSSMPSAAIVLRSGASAEMFSFIEQAQIKALLAIVNPPAKAVFPEFVIVKMFGSAAGSGAGTALVRGVPENIYSAGQGFHLLAGRLPRPGQQEVIVGRLASKRFAHMALGSPLQLTPNETFKVVGIFDVAGSALDSEVWGDLDSVREVFGRPGVVSSLRLRLDPAKLPELAEKIRSSRIGLFLQSDWSYEHSLSIKPKAFISVFGSLLGSLSILVAILASSTVFGSAIDERQSEILLLRRVGYGLPAVGLAVIIEAALLGVIGSAIGLLAAQTLSSYRTTIMSVSTWSNLVVSFDMTTSIMITCLVTGILIAIMASAIPAFKVARLRRLERA